MYIIEELYVITKIGELDIDNHNTLNITKYHCGDGWFGGFKFCEFYTTWDEAHKTMCDLLFNLNEEHLQIEKIFKRNKK